MSDVIYMTTIRELHSQLEEVTRQRDEALAALARAKEMVRRIIENIHDHQQFLLDLDK